MESVDSIERSMPQLLVRQFMLLFFTYFALAIVLILSDSFISLHFDSFSLENDWFRIFPNLKAQDVVVSSRYNLLD